jgi:predicted TIM-barrel fold metal-dependent hydrolase
VLLYGWPVLLDDVARAFPNLRLLVCHAGHPWIDECLVLISRHRNVYLDMSFMNSTLDQRETYGFLKRARQLGCPLSRICWATDYPGFEFPETLLPKLALVNRSAGDDPQVAQNDIARMLGGNYARFLATDGIDWSLEQTLEQMRSLDERWSGILGGKATDWEEPGGAAPGGQPRPRPHMCC